MYKELNEKILEMKEEILSAIKENIAFPSIKGEPSKDAPYGVACKQALDNAIEIGRRLGFKAVNIDNKVGYVEIGEGDEMVAILGHLDVVPLGDGWEHDPWGGEIVDGRMYGRGTEDDKGPTIGAFFALKAIEDLGLKINKRIRVIFGTDEESGSDCVKHYVESGQEMPVMGFTPDGCFPIIFAEKGSVGITLRKKLVDKGNIDVLELKAGVAKNVVAPKCHMVINMEEDSIDGEGITSVVENLKTTIDAVGVSAHASTPHLGKNSIYMTFNAISHLNFGGDFQKVLNFFREKLNNETNGKSLGVFCEDKVSKELTLNVGMINLVEDAVEFTIDIRVPVTCKVEPVLETIEKVAKEYDLELTSSSLVQPLYVPEDSELIQKLSKVYHVQTGEKPELLAIGGGTYAKTFPNMVAFGPTFPGAPEVIHQPNEYIEIDEFMKAMQVIAAAIYELAQ
ncbi:MAG: dipeptidase PepV [Filifactoraceae bacterium]